jgi:hypothetical protein
MARGEASDPLGYAEQIQQAIDHVESALDTDTEASRYLLLGSQQDFAMERDCWDEARSLCLRTLDRAAGDAQSGRHYSVYAYGFLCRIAHHRQDWQELLHWANLGEELARQMNYQHSLSHFLLWQALLTRREGDKLQAARLKRQATARLKRLQMTPSRDYYDALCAYHVLAEGWNEALRVRDEELRIIAGHSWFAYETKVHVKRCRVLAAMGRLQDADLEAARASARNLRRPEQVLVQIEQLRR